MVAPNPIVACFVLFLNLYVFAVAFFLIHRCVFSSNKSYKYLQVLINKDEVSVLELENSILLRPPDEREVNRIKPNPTLTVQPVFIDPGLSKKPDKGKQTNRRLPNGLHLEITGRVQHDNNELKHFMIDNAS